MSTHRSEDTMTYEQHMEDAHMLAVRAETDRLDREHMLALAQLHLAFARELREAEMESRRVLSVENARRLRDWLTVAIARMGGAP